MRQLLPECPSFADWYRAIHDRKPFPWQNRLANQVSNEHRWPRQIGVPTGLGKTACVDIAIWALASQAHLHPMDRTAPTRLWWVVNRRLLVDDTYNHAKTVAQRVAEAPDGPLADIGSRLRCIAGHSDDKDVPLQVIRMRGGVRRGRPSTPAQPAVICSTIPMFGSRILFRGYGTSRSMRPIDAALAYTDALIIIDEAHLATHLQELLAGLADLDSAEVPVLPDGRRSPVVVALTATGNPDVAQFDLGDDDHRHPEIRKRLDASKPVRLQVLEGATTPARVADGMVATVKNLLDRSNPGVVLVFVNSPTMAGLVTKRLRRRPDADVVVATGRIRGYEATAVTEGILAEARSGYVVGRERHLIVVATQTLEVGADIDADYLVTEACGVRALTQRLGRLNRLGTRPHAEGIYIHTPPGKRDLWPVYGHEPAAVLDRLQGHTDRGRVVDLPPGTIAEVLGPPNDRPGRAPVVALGILWEWIKTSTPPPGEAPVNPYFAGIEDPERHVTVAWRSHIPEPGHKLWPRVEGIETVEVPMSDVNKAINDLDSDQWALLGSDLVTVAPMPQAPRPGNTVLIRSDAGLLDRDGHWDPKATGPVLDVSIARSGLPVDTTALKQLYGGTPPDGAEAAAEDSIKALDEDDAEGVEGACRRLCESLHDAPPPMIEDVEEWNSLLDAVRSGIDYRSSQGRVALVEPRNEVPRLPRSHDDVNAGLIRSDEHDERSLTTQPLSLSEHSVHTADWASHIVDAVGIVEPLSRIVEAAARFHDVGKSDPRFQRWLNANQPLHHELLAKSGGHSSEWRKDRVAAGWPRGGRHEELSRRIIWEWLATTNHSFDSNEGDLLQHLIASHHGHGRPFVMPIEDDTDGHSYTYNMDGTTVTVVANLEIADWAQPTRFAGLNARYGLWGLALLETVVRQADHRASDRCTSPSEFVLEDR